jgi:hypothetical protein
MTTALEGGEGSGSLPGRSLPPGKTRYPLYRRLGGPQGRPGQVRKISPSTGIRSPDRPTRSQSLYRLSYLAHFQLCWVHLMFLVLEMLRDHDLQRWIQGRCVLSIVTSMLLCQNTIWREGKDPMTLSPRYLMEVRDWFHASTVLPSELYSSVTAG